MIPTDAEIRQALDVLDWTDDAQIRVLREGLSRTLRAWKVSVAAGPPTGVGAAAGPTWDRSSATLFWLIWQTSTECLEGLFNRS